MVTKKWSSVAKSWLHASGSARQSCRRILPLQLALLTYAEEERGGGVPPHPGAICYIRGLPGPLPEEATPRPRYISGPPALPPNDPTPDPTSGSNNACSGGGRRAGRSMHLSILGRGLGRGRWGGSLAAQKCNAGGGVPPPEGVRGPINVTKWPPGGGAPHHPVTLFRGGDSPDAPREILEVPER